MAVYEGSQGIAALKAKIAMKSKMLVGESLEKIAVMLVDESPLGAEYYASKQGAIQNDVGDFKNSWMVGLGTPNKASRDADAAGTAAVADAIIQGKRYNLEEVSYVSNNIGHADDVEDGWKDNPEYGWKAKEGYHVVGNNIGAAKAICELIANKVSKI
jgi:hypothetical protein